MNNFVAFLVRMLIFYLDMYFLAINIVASTPENYLFPLIGLTLEAS